MDWHKKLSQITCPFREHLTKYFSKNRNNCDSFWSKESQVKMIWMLILLQLSWWLSISRGRPTLYPVVVRISSCLNRVRANRGCRIFQTFLLHKKSTGDCGVICCWIESRVLFSLHPVFLSFILLIHEDYIGRSTGNSNPDMTSYTGGAKGCADHRFRASPAYTANC